MNLWRWLRSSLPCLISGFVGGPRRLTEGREEAMSTQALTGAPSSCLMPNAQLNSEPVLVSLVSLHSFHPEVTASTPIWLLASEGPDQGPETLALRRSYIVKKPRCPETALLAFRIKSQSSCVGPCPRPGSLLTLPCACTCAGRAGELMLCNVSNPPSHRSFQVR